MRLLLAAMAVVVVLGFNQGCVGQEDFIAPKTGQQVGTKPDLLSVFGWRAEVKRSSGETEVIQSGHILGLRVGQRAKIYAQVRNGDAGWHLVAIELCAENGRAIGLMMPSWPDTEDPIYENCIDVANEIQEDSWYQIYGRETEEYLAGDALAMRPGGGSLKIVLLASGEAGEFYEIDQMAVEYDIAPD